MKRNMRLSSLALSIAAVAVVGANCKGPVNPQTEKQFRAGLGKLTLTVYPSVCRSDKVSYDAASQQKLAAHFTDAKLATVTVSDARIDIPTKPGSNQSRMWRESAESFTAYVRANSPQTEYALLAEFLLNGRGEPIGIHAYVADAKGVLAYGVGLNSHHAVFSRNNPQTLDDAVRVLIEHLGRDLGGAAERVKPELR